MDIDDPFKPIHPGEFLREDFLVPGGISPDALAQAMDVSPDDVQALVEERLPITGDLALRLERALGSSAQFWMNLQAGYELDVARHAAERDKLDAIPNINPVLAAE
jgi:addiction module HigA family antidote